MKNIIFGLSSLVLASSLVACGGSDSPAAPTAPTAAPAKATITITAAGVDPKAITVPRGALVTVVNNSGSAMDVESGPHPAHTDCPELNLGSIGNGQTRQTLALNTVRTCAFHDHSQPGNDARKGTITIQ